MLEINPKHELIINIYNTKKSGSNILATLVAEQLFDNSLIAAGLIDDARSMLPRLNEILNNALDKK